MKLKYYLRGLGIGIIVTVIILTITNAGEKTSLTDEEIIQRAEQLGMVMPEEDEGEEESENALNEDELETDNISSDIQDTDEPDGETDEPSTTDTPDGEANAPATADTPDGEANAPATADTPDESIQASGENVKVDVLPGEHSYTISEKLFSVGAVDDPAKFNQFLVEKDIDNRIAVGSYSIPMGATYEELANILSRKP